MKRRHVTPVLRISEFYYALNGALALEIYGATWGWKFVLNLLYLWVAVRLEENISNIVSKSQVSGSIARFTC